MVLKIRLARFGKRHSPVYNIVLAHARTARNSRPLEVLGTYDPTPRVPLSSDLLSKQLSQASALEASSPQSTHSATKLLSTSTPYPSDPTSSALGSLVEEQQPEQQQHTKLYKNIQLDTSRVKYWLGVGAQPSQPVRRLLGMVGLVEKQADEEAVRMKV